MLQASRSLPAKRQAPVGRPIPHFSGGGSTISVATHFIDLFRLLTGKEIARVSATMHSRTHRGAVEDYSLLTMYTADGVSGACRDWRADLTIIALG